MFLVVINNLLLYIIMTEGFRFKFKKNLYSADINIAIFISKK